MAVEQPSALKYATGAMATMGACLFSNPLEVLKTRMQLQGEMQAKGAYTTQYRNVFHAFSTIWKNEGIRGIQKGLILGLGYQAVMNGTRLGIYDYIKERHYKALGRKMFFGENVVLAATSGAIAAVFGSPLYLVKTHQQAASNAISSVGYQHNHSGIIGAFRSIYSQSGIRGLWRGATGAIPRLAIGSSIQLSMYGECKHFVLNTSGLSDGFAVHVLASLGAGLFVAWGMNPFDVITTRLYNQPVDPVTGKGKFYKSYADCMKKTFTKEGIRGFYKGVTALYLRIGPHTVLTFVFWEQLRSLFSGQSL
eukprot:m.26368 g.26368  ORF g.26368 m.26368 type:complete len:308 (-) comp8820_c0_seq3:822-1745(-)